MEQRIDALEQDMKLIKNQIKAVLLDIKESLATGVGTPVYITQGESAESGESRKSNGGNEQPSYSGPATNQSQPVQPPVGDGGYSGAVNQSSVPFNSYNAPAAPVNQMGQGAEFNTGMIGHDAPGPHISQHELKNILNNAAEGSNGDGQAIDMLTLSVMAQWITRAVSSVGRERVVKLVGIYDMTGNLPERLKETMLMLADFHGNGHSGNGHEPDDSDEEAGNDSTEGIMQLLIELDSLIHCRKSAFESVMLSLLSEKGTGR